MSEYVKNIVHQSSSTVGDLEALKWILNQDSTHLTSLIESISQMDDQAKITLKHNIHCMLYSIDSLADLSRTEKLVNYTKNSLVDYAKSIDRIYFTDDKSLYGRILPESINTQQRPRSVITYTAKVYYKDEEVFDYLGSSSTMQDRILNIAELYQDNLTALFVNLDNSSCIWSLLDRVLIQECSIDQLKEDYAFLDSQSISDNELNAYLPSQALRYISKSFSIGDKIPIHVINNILNFGSKLNPRMYVDQDGILLDDARVSMVIDRNTNGEYVKSDSKSPLVARYYLHKQLMG